MPRGLRYAQSLARVHHVGCDRLRRIVAHSTNLDCRTNARLETMIVRALRMRNLAFVAHPLSPSSASAAAVEPVTYTGDRVTKHLCAVHEVHGRGGEQRNIAVVQYLCHWNATTGRVKCEDAAFVPSRRGMRLRRKKRKKKRRKSKKRRQAVTNIKWPTARCRPKCRRNDVVVVSVKKKKTKIETHRGSVQTKR